ncbi:hypothetical protein ACUXAV_004883 [Cupriavidus metallidurans]|jgi:hypothetical protein|uniref:Uncharacterized protein n=3 Tax=Cupriavidus TaxID=106589 RepID=Q1LAB4_CUPMC|nr:MULTISPECIES: hypothetical protein [Cupriavidus]ABF12912.1 hypothetical protein Rmet_6053 [Cupriavidus metallidurans CH34]AZG11996.1 hypothetical protein EHF44_00465 [Cupriavidus pauculus]MCA3186391.1 hypothetical protein [Cupriavidus sp.]MCA3188564.1 hypothetical protein [Cupriavidus sp.]MCA3235186.1 hypothetical protein [Cupriavidus sp.]
MNKTAGETSLATTIGMASMGCIDSEGQPKCSKFVNASCSGMRAMTCMSNALQDYPEARAEILLAGLTVVSKSSKNILEIRKFVPRMEMAVQVTA